ncbi:ABC transporter substrate-binding protein [Sinirhodobacter populi]|uniref:ABC transporter substrate-binding protein n=1 Tax=Paenirhodobacter populi TaxID=2306993 RepID=A0A443K5L6_9RHOB|nr:ABC transporter substrate-binding protein [Sinirhodobacter populi]RWR28042.1 ABC transporter substrate-binding protein [Sinirhodobacter populi]
MDRRNFLQAGVSATTLLGMGRTAFAQSGGALRKIVIGTTSGNSGATLFRIMRDRGIFEEFGLDAEILSVGDGNKIVTGVLAGDIDMCRASGFGQVLTAIEKGAALKVTGGASVLITQALFTSRPEIRTLKDLDGKTIGTGAPGALLHNMTTVLLRKNGIDPDSVTFVNIGSSNQVFRAVAAGTVDAGPSQLDVYDGQARFGVHSIADFWSELPEYPYQASYSSSRAIRDKRDTLVSCMAALGRLYDYVQGPGLRDSYVNAYVSATNGDPRDAESQWDLLHRVKPFDLNLDAGKVDYMQDLNLEFGIQKKKLPVDQVVDFSISADALKLLA